MGSIDSYGTFEHEEEILLMNHGDDSTTELVKRLNKSQRVTRLPDKHTVAELLEMAGGFGKAQWYSFFAVLLCNLAISFYSYNLPYLELKPQLSCDIENKFGVCSIEDVCQDPGFNKWQVDYSDKMTINNWMLDRDDFCIGHFKTGLIGSSMMVGVLLSTVISQMSDFIGRKRFIQVCSLCSILVVNLLFFAKDIDVRIILCLCIGMLNSIYYCSYSYLLEITPKKNTSLMSHLFMVSEGFVPTFSCSMFFLLGNKNWEHLFFFTLILAPLGLSLSFFLPKSPQYLFDNNEEESAKAELESISKMNGCELPENYKIVNEEEGSDSHSISEGKCMYFASFQNFLKLAIFSVILTYLCFNGVLFDYYVKYIEIDMFLINLLKSLGGAVSIVLSYTFLRFFAFKKVAITILILLALLALPLLGSIESNGKALIVISLVGISSCMTSLFVLMYYFVSESFPHAMVPLVLCLAHIVSNVLMIMSPEVAEVKGRLPIFIFLGATLFSLVSIVLYKKPEKEEYLTKD
ncbi:unnamed protein product [Moneuplotes crassus]|uniref:Uncharacterized protein n=1 Tax=Euplotes crassus TaxID=5936 RepID=A0AAD1X9P6_EUPCR|nr:unnamed protein product [Moneuplotes crassus]